MSRLSDILKENTDIGASFSNGAGSYILSLKGFLHEYG